VGISHDRAAHLAWFASSPQDLNATLRSRNTTSASNINEISIPILPSLPLSLLFLLPPSSAWGNLGHRTIALLAEKHFTPAATSYVQLLLGSSPISDAAIWADNYKFLPQGRYTSSWHFADARDDPPTTCGFSYRRDCTPDRTCIIDAIVNMTGRVNNQRLPHAERGVALKFLLHLIGDLHCPLHIEGLLRGGNDIAVLWEGRVENLHFVWDVLIPQKRTNSTEADEGAAAGAWAERLSGVILKDPNVTQGMAQGLVNTEDEFLGLLDNAEELAVRWAGETNAWVCRTVLRDGVEGVEGKELSGEYFIATIHGLEELVSNAGRRLAAWINELAKEDALQRGKGELK